MRLLITCLLAWVGCIATATAASRPNIVFILADDLGWADLSCYGSTFHETPHLDRLAAQGLRFTQAYAACPVCSPSRAAAMTGQYPARVGITDYIGGDRLGRLTPAPYLRQLPHEEVTIAEALRRAGYATGFIGKWHLGSTNSWPDRHGFDVNIGGCEKGHPPSYFSPYKIPTLKDGPKGEYLTDRLTDEAVQFIAAHTNQPFALFLWHYAVHNPQQAKAALIEKYQRKAATLPANRARFRAEGQCRDRRVQDMPVYAAMVQSLDESVGRVVDSIDALGLGEQTLIVFTSDNGGLSTSEGLPTSNAPLRAGKGWLYEGGIREAFLARWTGTIGAGQLSPEPMITPDVYPTFLAVAGTSAPPDQALDGVDMLPLWRDGAKPSPRPLFWHYPHYGNQGGHPGGAVRVGDFKLIEFYEDGHREMYDVVHDAGERNNLANQQPAKANELAQQLATWRRSIHAAMPTPNAAFNPVTEKQLAYVTLPATNGVLVLAARAADIHGTTVRYEPQTNKNTLGYWTRAEDWVSWPFFVAAPGEYRVEILQGCGPKSGGSDVEFIVGEQRLPVRVVETKGFQDFLQRDIGHFRFDRPGRHDLEVRPRKKPGLAVMDLRRVTLTRVGG